MPGLGVSKFNTTTVIMEDLLTMILFKTLKSKDRLYPFVLPMHTFKMAELRREYEISKNRLGSCSSIQLPGGHLLPVSISGHMHLGMQLRSETQFQTEKMAAVHRPGLTHPLIQQNPLQADHVPFCHYRWSAFAVVCALQLVCRKHHWTWLLQMC